MTDIHSHLIPGVDDGAATAEQAVEGVRAMWEQGVTTVVATPHLSGALTRVPERLEARLAELDAGWAVLRGAARAGSPGVRLERGVELMLDTPAPDLSDPRLRLAGSRFVLLEFAGMMVPPAVGEALRGLVESGVVPVVAHPERYPAVQLAPERVAEWVEIGCRLQVNAGSLLGRYGAPAGDAALAILRNGWASYLASDYHARGRPALSRARAYLEELGAAEQAELLLSANPRRIPDDQDPAPVPPLRTPKRGWWSRLIGR